MKLFERINITLKALIIISVIILIPTIIYAINDSVCDNTIPFLVALYTTTYDILLPIVGGILVVILILSIFFFIKAKITKTLTQIHKHNIILSIVGLILNLLIWGAIEIMYNCVTIGPVLLP